MNHAGVQLQTDTPGLEGIKLIIGAGVKKMEQGELTRLAWKACVMIQYFHEGRGAKHLIFP